MTTNSAPLPLDKLGDEFCALCWDEKIEEVKKFLEKNKDLLSSSLMNINELFNSRGQTALYCAASKGNVDLIHLLLQIDGIDINLRKGKSSTPLHAAGHLGHAQAVAILLIYGADDTIENQFNLSARAEAKKEALDTYQIYEEKKVLGLMKHYPNVAKKIEEEYKPKLAGLDLKVMEDENAYFVANDVTCFVNKEKLITGGSLVLSNYRVIVLPPKSKSKSSTPVDSVNISTISILSIDSGNDSIVCITTRDVRSVEIDFGQTNKKQKGIFVSFFNADDYDENFLFPSSIGEDLPPLKETTKHKEAKEKERKEKKAKERALLYNIREDTKRQGIEIATPRGPPQFALFSIAALMGGSSAPSSGSASNSTAATSASPSTAVTASPWSQYYSSAYTYPDTVVVPRLLYSQPNDVTNIINVSQLYHYGRFPIIAWNDLKGGCLYRSSLPRPDVSLLTLENSFDYLLDGIDFETYSDDKLFVFTVTNSAPQELLRYYEGNPQIVPTHFVVPCADDIVTAFETMCSVLLKFPVDKDQKSLFGSYVARAIGKEGDGKLVAKRRPTEKDSRKDINVNLEKKGGLEDKVTSLASPKTNSTHQQMSLTSSVIIPSMALQANAAMFISSGGGSIGATSSAGDSHPLQSHSNHSSQSALSLGAGQQGQKREFLVYCERFIAVAVSIVRKVAARSAVLVATEDQDDVSHGNVIFALVQVLLDPYYRTWEGFIKLVGKEFHYYQLQFEFAPYAPLVVLFLHCVATIMTRMSTAFEFSDKLLLFFADVMFDPRLSFLHQGSSVYLPGGDLSTTPLSPLGVLLGLKEKMANPLYNPREVFIDWAVLEKTAANIWISYAARYNAGVRDGANTAIDRIEEFVQKLNRSNEKTAIKFEMKNLPVFAFQLKSYSAFKHVTELSLFDLGLFHLNAEFLSIQSLTKVSLDNNYLSHIHLTATNLTSLSINNNLLSCISAPPQASFPGLTTLSLDNNFFHDMPMAVCAMKSLTTLSLCNNLIHSFHSHFRVLTNLKVLKLNQNRLTRIPDICLSVFSRLEELHLNNNFVSLVPHSIGQLASLHTLSLSDNKIERLVADIGYCTNLTNLVLSNNELSALPESVGNLTKLQKLVVVSNRLKDLPTHLAKCASLLMLLLQGNQFKSIPECLGELPKIEQLGFSSNSIRTINNCVGRLTSLKSLNLDNNRISHVPITVLSNPQLKLHFGVDGSTNAIAIPDLLHFKYTEAKKEILEQWKGEEEMIRVKLHVMGPNCGNKLQSTIVKALTKKWKNTNAPDASALLKEASSKKGLTKEGKIPTFYIDEEAIDISTFSVLVEPATAAVETEEEKAKNEKTKQNKKKREARLTIWEYKDFESFHTSHPLMYHQNQFYLLTFGFEKSFDDVMRWVCSILAHNKRPQIIFVMTTNRETFEENVCNLKTKLSSLFSSKITESASFLYFNEKHVDTISVLRNDLLRLVNANFRDILRRVPRTYLLFEEILLARAKERALFPVITAEEYISLGKQCGIRKLKDLHEFVHAISSENFFSFFSIPFLENYIILDNHWFCQTFRRICAFQKGYKYRHFLVGYPDVAQIWNHFDYPVHSFLVKVGEHFNLFYEITDTDIVKPTHHHHFLEHQGDNASQGFGHAFERQLMLIGNEKLRCLYNGDQSGEATGRKVYYVGYPLSLADFPFGGCTNSKLLVPSFLPLQRPTPSLKAQWDKKVPFQFMRLYQFQKFSVATYGIMLQHLLSSFLIPTEIWGTGIFGHAGVTEAQATGNSNALNATLAAPIALLSSSTEPQEKIEWADQVWVEIPPDNSGNVSKILIVIRSHNEQRAKSLFSRCAEIVEVLADAKGIKCSRFAFPSGVEVNMSLESPLEGLQTYDLYPINTIQELIIRGTRTVAHQDRLIPIAHFAPDISMDEYITDPTANNTMIPGKAIKKDKLLGVGGYAKVYLATIDTAYKEPEAASVVATKDLGSPRRAITKSTAGNDRSTISLSSEKPATGSDSPSSTSSKTESSKPDATKSESKSEKSDKSSRHSKASHHGLAASFRDKLASKIPKFSSSTQFAMKEIIFDNKADEKTKRLILREFRREILIQRELQHPNIVQLYGISMESPIAMILELVPHGNLFEHIQNHDVHINWTFIKRALIELARGLEYMHSKKIGHFDMKSPNIMLDSLAPDSAKPIVKIADFGTSRKIKTMIRGKFVENPLWLAPEVLMNKPYCLSVDTYAFGIICWEMLTREKVFGVEVYMSEVESKIIRGIRPALPTQTSKLMTDLVTQCWTQEPLERPAWPHIVSQLTQIDDKEYETTYGIPFFKELSKKLELNKKAEADLRKRKEEIERKRKERQAKREKMLEEKHVRTQRFLAKSSFLNLIPSEIMPTFNFYMEYEKAVAYISADAALFSNLDNSMANDPNDVVLKLTPSVKKERHHHKSGSGGSSSNPTPTTVTPVINLPPQQDEVADVIQAKLVKDIALKFFGIDSDTFQVVDQKATSFVSEKQNSWHRAEIIGKLRVKQEVKAFEAAASDAFDILSSYTFDSLGKVKSLNVQFGIYLSTVGIEMDEFDLYFKLLEEHEAEKVSETNTDSTSASSLMSDVANDSTDASSQTGGGLAESGVKMVGKSKMKELELLRKENHEAYEVALLNEMRNVLYKHWEQYAIEKPSLDMMDKDNQDKLNHLLSSMDQTETEVGADEGSGDENDGAESDRRGRKDAGTGARGKETVAGRHSGKLKHSKTVDKKDATKELKDTKDDKEKPKEKPTKKKPGINFFRAGSAKENK